MERVIGVDHYAPRCREVAARSERLRHRRAAGERCLRTGLLRRCTELPPAQDRAAGVR